MNTKISQCVTAAAVAAALGFPAGTMAFANAFDRSAYERLTTESAAQRDRRLASIPRIEQQDAELAALPDRALDTNIAQHIRLIENVRSNADSEGALTARDETRLQEAEESLAVYALERDRRDQPSGRKTDPDGTQSDAAQQRGGSPAMTRLSAGSARGAQLAAATRNGVIFEAGARNFATRLFGAVTPSREESVEDFFNALATNTYPHMAMGRESVGVDGGFDVPPIFYTGLIDQALQGSEFAQRCRIFPADSNNLTIPMVDSQNRDMGVAGLLAPWSAEAQQAVPQTLKWRAVQMKLKKTFVLSEASSELVEDGLQYSAQLEGAMSIATAQTLDAAILYGSGVGQPLGILNSEGAISIEPESGQVADTVLFENLVNAYSRLLPAAQKRATWFVSPSVLPALMRVKVPDTDAPALLSGGSNDAASGAPAMSIFGRPVVVTEISPQLGDKGDIVFADMSAYGLLLRNRARMEQSNAPKFDEDVISFRMIMRVDGVPLWPAPITPYNGGPTMTWASYLAARS